MPGRFGACKQVYCFKCERKRKCYRFQGFCANDRNTVVIADSSLYPLCQECAYKVNGTDKIDHWIKLGFLAAWKPSTPIRTQQLQMPMEGTNATQD